MNEYEPRPAPAREIPDWRRLEVTMQRFGDRIADGIAKAGEFHTGIDSGTARCIAHTLGRALGRESALAEFGRTGEGDYEAIRDEYLTIYHDPEAAAWTIDLINWFGSHLIRRDYPSVEATDRREESRMQISRLLVPTAVQVGELTTVVHVPGSYDSSIVPELEHTLTELRFDEDPGLQAFLSLPDVNAVSGDIMQDFHDHFVGTYPSMEDAIHEITEVDERERDVQDYAEQRHLFIEQVSPDYEALIEETVDGYDIVERNGRAYVFYK